MCSFTRILVVKNIYKSYIFLRVTKSLFLSDIMKTKFTTIISIITLCFNSALAGDYPTSSIEKEMDEMGSLAGGEGIVFRPSKEKSTATKTVGNINKYLYQASIDVLKIAPLASADSQGGTVITEWYSPHDQKNTQFKITVYIKDKLIAPEALEVIAFQRKKHNGKWSDTYEPSPIAIVLEDKILRKARELYQQSK